MMPSIRIFGALLIRLNFLYLTTLLVWVFCPDNHPSVYDLKAMLCDRLGFGELCLNNADSSYRFFALSFINRL